MKQNLADCQNRSYDSSSLIHSRCAGGHNRGRIGGLVVKVEAVSRTMLSGTFSTFPFS